MQIMVTSIVLILTLVSTVCFCQESCETSNLTISNGSLQTSGTVAHGDDVHFVCDPQLFLSFGGINETSVICNNGTWETEYNSLMCSEADYEFCYNLEQAFYHPRSESCFFGYKQKLRGNESSNFCKQRSGSGWRGRAAIFIDQTQFDEIQLKLMESKNLPLQYWYWGAGFWLGLKRIDKNGTFMWYEGKENQLVSNLSQISFPNIDFDLSVSTQESGIFPFTAFVTFDTSAGWSNRDRYGANEIIKANGAVNQNNMLNYVLCEFIFMGEKSNNAPGSCRVSDILYSNGTIDSKESVSSEIIQDGQGVTFLCNGAMSLANDVTRRSSVVSCNNGYWNYVETLSCVKEYDYLLCQRIGGVYFHLTRACYKISVAETLPYPFNYRFCEDSATPGWRGRLIVLSSQELHDFLFENANSLIYYGLFSRHYWIGLRNLIVPWERKQGQWYENKNTVVANFTELNGLGLSLSNSKATCRALLVYGNVDPFKIVDIDCNKNAVGRFCEYILTAPDPGETTSDCKYEDIEYSNGFLLVENNTLSETFFLNGQIIKFVCNQSHSLTYDGTVTETDVTCVNGTWKSEFNLTCMNAIDINFCQEDSKSKFFLSETKSCFERIITKDITYLRGDTDCQAKAKSAGWRGRLAVLPTLSVLNSLGSMENTVLSLPSFVALRSVENFHNISTWKWYDGTRVLNDYQLAVNIDSVSNSKCTGYAMYKPNVIGKHDFDCIIPNRYQRSINVVCEYQAETDNYIFTMNDCNFSDLNYINGTLSGKPLMHSARDGQIIDFNCNDGLALDQKPAETNAKAVCNKGTWELTTGLTCSAGKGDHNFCDKISGYFSSETNSCFKLYQFGYAPFIFYYHRCKAEGQAGWRGRFAVLRTKSVFDSVVSAIRVPGKTKKAYVGLVNFGNDARDAAQWTWIEGYNTFIANFSNISGVPFSFDGNHYGILESIRVEGGEHLSDIDNRNNGAESLCEFVKEEQYFAPITTTTSSTTTSADSTTVTSARSTSTDTTMLTSLINTSVMGTTQMSKAAKRTVGPSSTSTEVKPRMISTMPSIGFISSTETRSHSNYVSNPISTTEHVSSSNVQTANAKSTSTMMNGNNFVSSEAYSSNQEIMSTAQFGKQTRNMGTETSARISMTDDHSSIKTSVMGTTHKNRATKMTISPSSTSTEVKTKMSSTTPSVGLISSTETKANAAQGVAPVSKPEDKPSSGSKPKDLAQKKPKSPTPLPTLAPMASEKSLMTELKHKPTNQLLKTAAALAQTPVPIEKDLVKGILSWQKKFEVAKAKYNSSAATPDTRGKDQIQKGITELFDLLEASGTNIAKLLFQVTHHFNQLDQIRKREFVMLSFAERQQNEELGTVKKRLEALEGAALQVPIPAAAATAQLVAEKQCSALEARISALESVKTCAIPPAPIADPAKSAAIEKLNAERLKKPLLMLGVSTWEGEIFNPSYTVGRHGEGTEPILLDITQFIKNNYADIWSTEDIDEVLKKVVPQFPLCGFTSLAQMWFFIKALWDKEFVMAAVAIKTVFSEGDRDLLQDLVDSDEKHCRGVADGRLLDNVGNWLTLKEQITTKFLTLLLIRLENKPIKALAALAYQKTGHWPEFANAVHSDKQICRTIWCTEDPVLSIGHPKITHPAHMTPEEGAALGFDDIGENRVGIWIWGLVMQEMERIEQRLTKDQMEGSLYLKQSARAVSEFSDDLREWRFTNQRMIRRAEKIWASNNKRTGGTVGVFDEVKKDLIVEAKAATLKILSRQDYNDWANYEGRHRAAINTLTAMANEKQSASRKRREDQEKAPDNKKPRDLEYERMRQLDDQ